MKQMTIPNENKIDLNFDTANLPVSIKIFQPLLFIDGNGYCCVLGPDPQEGIFGSGNTPDEALFDWDESLRKRIKTTNTDDKVAQYVINCLKTSIDDVW